MHEGDLLLHKGDSAQAVGDAQADVSGDASTRDGQRALDDGHARGNEQRLPDHDAPLAQRLEQLLQLRLDRVALVPARSDILRPLLCSVSITDQKRLKPICIVRE